SRLPIAAPARAKTVEVTPTDDHRPKGVDPEDLPCLVAKMDAGASEDDLFVTTLKCTSCGKTWLDRETAPGDISPSRRSPEGWIVCSNCGARNVTWEIGWRKSSGDRVKPHERIRPREEWP